VASHFAMTVLVSNTRDLIDKWATDCNQVHLENLTTMHKPISLAENGCTQKVPMSGQWAA